jgi:hypothetical protein
MFKPCPTCGFLVALIAGREASQRCPRCGSALLGDGEHVEVDDTPARPLRATAAAHSRFEAEAEAAMDAGPARTSIATVPTAPAHDTVVELRPEPPTDAAAAPPAHHGPSFARRRERSAHSSRRWPGWTAIAVLALLLALQLLLAQRAELARDAGWRPLVLRACALLRCDVPAWHEPQAYAMLARGVRPGARPGVLHVSATVRNDARWPQAAPVVVLSLSDVDGRVVGATAVDPAHYGHAGAVAVPPGDSLDIAFDVREPAAHVESFDFQLQ